MVARSIQIKMSEALEKLLLRQSPAAIAVVALALRLVAMHFFYHSTYNVYENHLLFGFETGRISRSIAEGHGFGNPLFVETGPTAWMSPVYPYLLAAVFKLLGVYSKASALLILGLNCSFSALICVPVFYIAQRSFGRSVALWASWMWALSPYSIFLSSSFVWETCLAALLAALLFLWSLQLRQRPNSGSWFGFGVLSGFSALTNASTLILCPVLAAWALFPLRQFRQRWLKAALLVAFGLVITLFPWELRNYGTFQSVIPLRDNFWLEFWVGNDGNMQSWLDSNAHPSINPAQKAEFVRLGEIPYMREKRRESLSFLTHHLGLYFVLCLRRFVYLWTGFWNLDPSNLQDELHGFGNVFLMAAVTLAMLLGLWRALRIARSAAIPFVLVLVFYPLLFYLTHPTIRYRHVIDPEIFILAALGVKSLLSSPSLDSSTTLSPTS